MYHSPQKVKDDNHVLKRFGNEGELERPRLWRRLFNNGRHYEPTVSLDSFVWIQPVFRSVTVHMLWVPRLSFAYFDDLLCMFTSVAMTDSWAAFCTRCLCELWSSGQCPFYCQTYNYDQTDESFELFEGTGEETFTWMEKGEYQSIWRPPLPTSYFF